MSWRHDSSWSLLKLSLETMMPDNGKAMQNWAEDRSNDLSSGYTPNTVALFEFFSFLLNLGGFCCVFSGTWCENLWIPNNKDKENSWWRITSRKQLMRARYTSRYLSDILTGTAVATASWSTFDIDGTLRVLCSYIMHGRPCHSSCRVPSKVTPNCSTSQSCTALYET